MPYLPYREAVAWVDHGIMPESGGFRDQPIMLWMQIEAFSTGIIQHRNQKARDDQEALLARLSMR